MGYKDRDTFKEFVQFAPIVFGELAAEVGSTVVELEEGFYEIVKGDFSLRIYMAPGHFPTLCVDLMPQENRAMPIWDLDENRSMSIFVIVRHYERVWAVPKSLTIRERLINYRDLAKIVAVPFFNGENKDWDTIRKDWDDAVDQSHRKARKSAIEETPAFREFVQHAPPIFGELATELGTTVVQIEDAFYEMVKGDFCLRFFLAGSPIISVCLTPLENRSLPIWNPVRNGSIDIYFVMEYYGPVWRVPSSYSIQEQLGRFKDHAKNLLVPFLIGENQDWNKIKKSLDDRRTQTKEARSKLIEENKTRAQETSVTTKAYRWFSWF